MAASHPLSSPFRADALSGKVCVCVGGGSGIGYEIAKQLLVHGCAGAVLCGRREPFLVRACDSLRRCPGVSPNARVAHAAVDVRDPEQCRKAVGVALSTFGRLDVLVNGAAGNFLAEAGREGGLTPKGFQTVLDIDAGGTYNMCHAAHDALRRSGGGVVINISATLQYGATWYQAHASAAKSAVDSLTRSLALEWGSDGIRVNGIAPGPIADTPGMTKLGPDIDTDSMAEMVSEGIPLGRMGTAFDIGMAAVFLCSDGGAAYVTGDVLVCDGGHWLFKPPLVPREMVAELSRRVEGKSREQAPRITSKL